MKSNARAAGGRNPVEALPSCAQTIVPGRPAARRCCPHWRRAIPNTAAGFPDRALGRPSTTSMFGARISDARR